MNKKTIVLIGADGQLGSDLYEILDPNVTEALNYPNFDLTRPEQVQDILGKLEPSVVINTAAFNRVDECETRPLEAFEVNAVAVRDLAQICLTLGSVLVHFSSDYVFNGEKKEPYTEEDTPHPLSVYGLSKLTGEIFIQNLMDRFFLIRTCGLFGKEGCWGTSRNFVDTMVEAALKNKPLRVVCDQSITPTSTSELAKRVLELLDSQQFGIYHMTNEGQCSWYEFACAIFEVLQKDVDLTPVDSSTFGAMAKRPAYSVLAKCKAYRAGVSPFSQWKEALKVYMKEKGYLKADFQAH